jgi:hypothetical protein
MKKMLRIPFVTLVAVLVCWNSAYATAIEGQHTISSTQSSLNSTYDVEGPVFRQGLIDSFERATIAPWTSAFEPAGGSHNWAIRDTTQTYGPNDVANSGYRYAGYPPTDIAVYVYEPNPGKRTRLTSPTIDLTGWTACFLTFAVWSDLEGTTTTFDGGYVEISPDNGTTWYQIDSLAEGHLDPTYDARLSATGQSGNMYAYCYDHQFWRNVVTQNLFLLGYVSAGDQVRLRFTFDRDAVDGGQGFFIDDVTLTETAPPDNQAPVITHTPLTDTPDYENAYTVTADVIDYGAGVDPDSVYLYYKIEDGSWIPEPMINTSGNTYEAAIPPQDWWTDVYYYIEAADQAAPPNMSMTPEYYFEVGVAKLISYDDGNPWWAISGLVGPGAGVYNMFDFNDVGLDSALLHKIIIFFNMPDSITLEFYEFSGGWPGSLISSASDQPVSGVGWDHWDITEACGESLKVYTNQCLGGYILPPGPDTLLCGIDSILDNPVNMWIYLGSWQQTPQTSGDFIIRMKVIELPIPEMGVSETPQDQHVGFDLTYSKPNPMRTSAVIEYHIPIAQKVSLRIYDITGELVRTLFDTQQETGTHHVVWDGIDERGKAVASGVYFYQLQGENESKTQKLIVTR